MSSFPSNAPRPMLRLILPAVLYFVCPALRAATLRPETLKAWEQYIHLTEARIGLELHSEQGFFAHDFFTPSEASSARQTIRSGEIFAQRMETRNEEGKEIDIPDGMIHHWLGGTFIRGVTLDEVLAWLQEISHFQRHFPEVAESRLLSRSKDALQIFLKLRRKKIRAVHYNTEHIVRYWHYGPEKASSRTEAIRIAQLENPGTPQEREMPPGQDSGYLWRLNSYWRFKQEPGGVIVEFESIGLSRGIPAPLRWLIAPFTRSVPEQMIETTLEAMRGALAQL